MDMMANNGFSTYYHQQYCRQRVKHGATDHMEVKDSDKTKA
jgi:hypothetical protein